MQFSASFSSLQSVGKKIAAIKNCKITGWQNVNEDHTFFRTFGIFQREFLRNYLVYRAQIFRDN